MGFEWPVEPLLDPARAGRAPRRAPSIEVFERENCDCIITIDAPANMRQGSDLRAERFAAWRSALRPYTDRVIAHEIPWVGCQHPTRPSPRRPA